MEHENAALYRRLTSAFQSGDVEMVKGVLAPDLRWHEAGNPDVIKGRDVVLERMGGTGRHVEVSVDLHDVLANDEHVVAMATATFSKPDGTKVSYPAVDIVHVSNGLFTERWAFMDACPPEVTAFFADLS